MIDPDLHGFMSETAPRFNMDVAQGYAYHESDKFIPNLEALLKVWKRTLNKAGIPLNCHLTHCTPYERFSEMTRPRNSKCNFEITRSHFRLMKVVMTLGGREIKPRFIWVPFINPDGTLTLRDSNYLVIPTLKDHLFSIENGNIFFPVTRAKLMFQSEGYHYVADGRTESADYYWSKPHHNKKNEAPASRHPQLLNYLLVVHGLTETFKRFYGADVVAGNAATINDVDFPEEEWVICTTAGTRPKGRISTGAFIPSDTRLAVRREHYGERTLKSAIVSLFYMIDICSQLDFFDPNDFDDSMMWKRTLARFIWKTIDEREAINHIEEHLMSLGDYVDELVLDKLRYNNIDVTDINELFVYMLTNFSPLVINNDVSASLDKRISVVDEVMYPICSMLFYLMFLLLRQPATAHTEVAITRLMDTHWKPMEAFNLGTTVDSVQVLESTTDQKVWKMTCKVHAASRSNSGKSSSKSAEMNDPSFRLHPDMPFTCSILGSTKASPSAHGTMNIFTPLDKNGGFILKDELVKYHENLKVLLRKG